jgi:tetratricopeptide (TPR) repeat protein
MHTFEPPDTHYLSSAIGWLELGNPTEARAELAQITPRLQTHPAVLELRWLICAKEAQWEEGLALAESLIAAAPDEPTGWLHRAYALRRVPNGTLQQAWDALRPAADKFPKEAIIAFNLACYACQMQQMDTALEWVKRAMDKDEKDQIKKMALEDPDLQPLAGQIRKL